MKIIDGPGTRKSSEDIDNKLKILEEFKKDIESGKVAGFSITSVSTDPDGSVWYYDAFPNNRITDMIAYLDKHRLFLLDNLGAE